MLGYPNHISSREEALKYERQAEFIQFLRGETTPQRVRSHIDQARRSKMKGVEFQCFNYADWIEHKEIAIRYADEIGWCEMELYGTFMFDERKNQLTP